MDNKKDISFNTFNFQYDILIYDCHFLTGLRNVKAYKIALLYWFLFKFLKTLSFLSK